MESIPLLAHDSPESVVAYRSAKPITARQFVADVRRLAAVLPAGQHVLNACSDRYRFAVGLGASLVTNKTTLLPPTHPPEVIRQLRIFAPDAICLSDDAGCDIALPIVRYPSDAPPPLGAWQVPTIRSDQRAAYVFTSGSTGTPVPHPKTWARLADVVRVEADRLGLNDERHHVIVATVPPQHMYGFESSVLLALHSGNAFCAERPFFPADVASVLAALPRPRVLVSTPIHLRTLLAAGAPIPAVDLVVSATAPLDAATAREVERRFGALLLEIYGSTETGQIASRRTVNSAEWLLWPEVELIARDGQVWAQGGHIETPTVMGDVLEITASGRFLLGGRTADLVNIAGKRSSIAYLNHQLHAIPGVADGAFFLRAAPGDESPNAVARLGAVVVAPGLTAAEITRHLRERVDPVFLPRPLLIVDHIPRNSSGKLTLSVLQSLTAQT